MWPSVNGTEFLLSTSFEAELEAVSPRLSAVQYFNIIFSNSTSFFIFTASPWDGEKDHSFGLHVDRGSPEFSQTVDLIGIKKSASQKKNKNVERGSHEPEQGGGGNNFGHRRRRTSSRSVHSKLWYLERVVPLSSK